MRRAHRTPLSIALAVLAWAALVPAALAQPVLAPDTVVDGPSAAITELSGLSVARDGTGGLVYVKDISGVGHVFLSRLLNGAFQPPQQVDTGLAGASSEPVIAAGHGGLLLIAFINAGQLYTASAANGLSPLGAPALLFSGAVDPAISITTLSKAYLAFTSVGSGGDDVRVAYYVGGLWSPVSAPLDAAPGDNAGLGTGRPAVAAAQDGVAIVVWGEAGHIYSRRVWGTAPSVVYEQADVTSLAGASEVTADEPAIAAGGNSSYAAVVFREVLSTPSGQQARVLFNRLQGSQYNGVRPADGLSTPGPEGAQQPQVAVTEYGRGFVTASGEQSEQLLGTPLGTNETLGAGERVDSLQNAGVPYAIPASAGLYSNLIAWQQDPGAAGIPEIRLRYAQDGSDLGPEQVVSVPGQGPADAANGLLAAGDGDGDAVIAWVQGTGAAAQIVAAQLYQPPGGIALAPRPPYAVSANPLLSWTPSGESWGPVSYTVRLDGVAVTQTEVSLIRVPTPVSDGRHTWQVTAVNRAGETAGSNTGSFFVDTVAPTASFTLTGPRRVGSYLHIYVTYADLPPANEPGATASGVASVRVMWGDGSSYQIRHGKFHAYRKPGLYTITVIVKDRAGHTTTLHRQVTISPKPKPKPKPKKPPSKKQPAKHG
jgi:hypothetical protein